MARKLRHWSPGLTYHIMAQGVRQVELFQEPADYKFYLKQLQRARNRYGFDLHAYCLMNNHIHLLLETHNIHISKVMHMIQTNYAMYFNRKYQLYGHVFHGRYVAESMEDEKQFYDVSRDIHLTPVRTGVAEEPCSYAWSSAKDYGSSHTALKVKHPLLTFERTLKPFPAPREQHFLLFLTHNIPAM